MENMPIMGFNFKNGVLIGLAVVLYQLLIYIFGMANNKTLGNLTLLILVIGVFFAVKKYRDKYCYDGAGFNDIFKASFVCFIGASMIGAVFAYIQFKHLTPGMMDEFAEMAKKSMLSQELTDEEQKIQENILQKLMTPGFMAFIYLLAQIFWGALYSLLNGILLKKAIQPK